MSKKLSEQKLRVLIPDGDNHFAVSVLRSLGLTNRFHSIVLGREQYPPSRYSRHCHAFRQLSSDIEIESEDYIQSIFQTAVEFQAEIVLPAHRLSPILTDSRSLFEEAGIALAPTPPRNAYSIADDKSLFAKFLVEKSLEHPKTFLSSECDTLQESNICFPVLYKPCEGANGSGIQRFHDLPSLQQHILNSEQPAVIQEEIPGTDICCNVFAVEGELLAATIQRPLLNNTTEFRAADAIEFIEDDQVLQACTELMAALNWSGVTHIDLRYDENTEKLYFIEMNPRFWGSLLGSVSAGVNFPELICEYTLTTNTNTVQIKPGSRYCGMSGYLRQLRSPLNNRKNHVSFKNSQASYFLTDPLPEVFEKLQRLFSRS